MVEEWYLTKSQETTREALSDFIYVQTFCSRHFYLISNLKPLYLLSQKKIIIQNCFKGTSKQNVRKRTDSPGKRCMRTLTILSRELNTKLQRQTINAHANGPCLCIWNSQQLYKLIITSSQSKVTVDVLLTSANEKQTMKNFSFLG